MVSGKKREQGRQVNIENVITIIIENIQEANKQVRNTENELRCPLELPHISVLLRAQPKLCLSCLISGVQCFAHSLPFKDPLVLFLAVVLACLLESFLNCPGLHVNSAQ